MFICSVRLRQHSMHICFWGFLIDEWRAVSERNRDTEGSYHFEVDVMSLLRLSFQTDFGKHTEVWGVEMSLPTTYAWFMLLSLFNRYSEINALYEFKLMGASQLNFHLFKTSLHHLFSICCNFYTNIVTFVPILIKVSSFKYVVRRKLKRGFSKGQSITDSKFSYADIDSQMI